MNNLNTNSTNKNMEMDKPILGAEKSNTSYVHNPEVVKLENPQARKVLPGIISERKIDVTRITIEYTTNDVTAYFIELHNTYQSYKVVECSYVNNVVNMVIDIIDV